MNTEMEMPTPCTHCGNIFDLYDGFGSEKWHKDVVICEDCHILEEKEIEEDDYWEGVNIELSNALYSLDKVENISEKLDNSNKEIIKAIAEKL